MSRTRPHHPPRLAPSSGRGEGLGNLSIIEYQQDDLDVAQGHAEAALYLYRQLGDLQGQTSELLNLAAIYRTRDDLTMALRLQNDALKLARKLGNPDNLFRILVSRGETHLKAGRSNQAYADYHEAIEHMETMRGGLTLEEHKIGFLRGGKITVYQRMVQLLWGAIGRAGEALTCAERAKSRVLLELLATTPLTPPSGIDEAILAQEQELVHALRVQERALRLAPSDGQRRAIAAEIAAGQEKHHQLIKSLASMSPEYAALRLGHPLSFAEVSELLQTVS
jgi:tetratricopeptide (TPR) repeat protein